MKPLPFFTLAIFLAGAAICPASTLLLDFGPTTITSGFETVSPGHANSAVPLADTTWNSRTSGASTTSLSYADGSAAAGVSLIMGQESSAGSGTITLNGTVTGSLAGSGGGVVTQPFLIGAGRIYGQGNPTMISSTAGRDALFGAAGSAVGLRVDGLAAGTYDIYTMARNTNSNAASVPMNIYAAAGSFSGSFTFSALFAAAQANTGFTTAAYTNQYSVFIEGENHVKNTVILASGESLFLAVDGAPTGETRGFLNMVQIVAVPEPSVALLGTLGLIALFRRRI